MIPALLCVGLLSACQRVEPTATDAAPQPAPPASATNATPAAAPALSAIPASLAPFGNGYPTAGSPCLRLGESEATLQWLDDSADLVGCPDAASAAALGGKVVATIEGATVVSVPRAVPPASQPVEGTTDALVPGTAFHATTSLPCSADGGRTMATCEAGVIRAQAPDQFTTVEITRPDGRKRVISFRATTAIGADGSQADGASGYTFKATRSSDNTIIDYGPEHYVITDALIVGG
ncbi:hypothetical protein N800_11545 [Lysobacter daejeonensis GH1-9]|uniref:Uncharacterized protein n=2 Tax=Aerolutibacter TaxID=3382701 RepID=A0A0A0EZM3_9GAMM|nr:hypothetical protein N800_11545 [Lysobacter daejeonensis GH1-9]